MEQRRKGGFVTALNIKEEGRDYLNADDHHLYIYIQRENYTNGYMYEELVFLWG